MRVTELTLDADQDLETITVVMSVAEANAIVGVFGKFNGIAHSKMGLGKDDSPYGALWDLFVKFYEDGHPTGLPHVPELATINTRP